MRTVYRGTRRRVILYLIDRLEYTFPEDWSEDETIKDVIRKWLIAEGDRR